MHKNEYNWPTISFVSLDLSPTPGDGTYEFFDARFWKRLTNKWNAKAEVLSAVSGVHELSSLRPRDAISTDSHPSFGVRNASVFRVIILQSIRRKLYKLSTSRLLRKARNPRAEKQPRGNNQNWSRENRLSGHSKPSYYAINSFRVNHCVTRKRVK
jgi:hypothetical protein